MSLTRFGDALILAISSCPKWPRQRDLKNVPGQAKDLNSLFQDLGFCTWHPDQEELTLQGVKDAVADLCQRTERNLQEMSEENCLVTVAVLSHGRKRAASELPDMVCYDSFGEHIDSNDADLDEVLIDGFCRIHVPEGKSLKVWLLLDCCQSNEEMNRWRAPERMTKLEGRRCFGHPSLVDFLFFFPCDPGREAHDYFSMSKAITEILTCRVQPIKVYDACRSAMKLVQKWSGRTVRPRIVERGDFGDIWFPGRLPDHWNLARLKRFLLQLIGFLNVLFFLIIVCICYYHYGHYGLYESCLYWYRRAPRIDFLPAFPTGHFRKCSFDDAVRLCLCSVYCLAEVRSGEMVREIQKMVSERTGSGFLARVRNMFGFDRAEERLYRAIESHKWWRTLERLVFVMILLWYHWYPGMDLPWSAIFRHCNDTVRIVNCLLWLW